MRTIRRPKACSICRREGHDRRAHVLDAGLLGRRTLELGSVTLTVEVRGNVATMLAEHRAVLFGVIDLVNAAMVSDRPACEATP